MNIKVLLVDDHAMLRSGLRLTLAQNPNLTLVGEATTGAQALSLVKETQPDLVLMDIHMADMNGLEASRKILEDHPGIKIVVFSSETSRSMVDEALEIGVCGYLSKSGSVEEINTAIEAVNEGKLYLSPEVSGDILSDYRRGLRDDLPGKTTLSDREKHLLRLVAEGLRNKEISAELAVSIKSVEAYRSRLMKRLGCDSSAELVRYAVREGIAKL